MSLQEKSQTDTLHFWDGERKIDMILAYVEDDDNGQSEDIKKAQKRKTFQRNLEKQGLELELEPSDVRIFFMTFPKNYHFELRRPRSFDLGLLRFILPIFVHF